MPSEDKHDRAIRILSLDDNPMDRALIKDALERESHDFFVIEASDRTSFEQQLERGGFDLVLTDLDILGFEGLEVIRRVQERLPDTPVIVVTGTGSEETAVEALKAGAADYVIKSPSHIAQLPHTIRRVLAAAQTRRRLAQRDAKLHAVMASVQDAIILSDQDGRVSYWNDAAERIFGYSEQEALGRPMEELIIPKRLQAGHKKGWSRFAQMGPGRLQGQVLEMPARRKEGTEIPVELTVGAFQTDGQWQAVAVVRDMSKRKELEEWLREAQKLEAMGRLAGGLAHDFNNTLSVVVGFAQLLVSETDPSDPHHALAAEILDAGRRSAKLVSQLLTFSRKDRASLESLDVNRAVRDKLTMFKHLLGPERTVELRLSEDLPLVRIGAGQLDQVLVNLVLNAKDAMDNKGHITIETQARRLDDQAASARGLRQGDYVEIRVSDDGCGMSKEVQNRIFEPFFTTKPPGQGTGLGLATVYGIVTHLEGSISVESQPGKGTTFDLLLPADDAPAPTDSSGHSSSLGWHRRTHKPSRQILLVDDEESLRRLMSKILDDLGYRIAAASSGPEALEMVEAGQIQPDLLITDVLMPDLNGQQLAERLRETHPDINVIYVSGHTADFLDDKTGRDSAFIQKPFELKEFVELVEKML